MMELKNIENKIHKIKIHISNYKINWIIEKIYKEIYELNKSLLKFYPKITSLPENIIHNIKDITQIEEIKKLIEKFLKECLSSNDILFNKSFKEFIEFDKHSSEIEYNYPKKIYTNDEIPLVVRDYFFFEEENILYLLCCYIEEKEEEKFHFLWKKSCCGIITLCAILAFKIIEKENSYNFEKIWIETYNYFAYVINFNKNKLILLTGLEHGKIKIYQTSKESKYTIYSLLFDYKPHINKITGLDYDDKEGYIYSCSKDKTFVMTEIYNISNVIEIAKSSYGYTGLILDKKNKRIFLTDEGGYLSIFITSVFPHNLVTIIKTFNSNYIKAFDINYNKQYIFTGNKKGNISIINLDMPKKRKLIREIAHFEGKQKTNVLRYNPDKNELYSGEKKGIITVWSLENQKSIFSWKVNKQAITQMIYDRKKKILITMDKDKKIIFWKIPELWINLDVNISFKFQ